MRNVIISAGSESVWLNGIEMKRGQDRDYIIDYTSGELIFTPKHLIYFDSDIEHYNKRSYNKDIDDETYNTIKKWNILKMICKI